MVEVFIMDCQHQYTCNNRKKTNVVSKTRYLHVPTQCFLFPDMQHAALLFTEATDMGKVLSPANAINTTKWPISSAAFAQQPSRCGGDHPLNCSSATTVVVQQWLIPN